MNNLRDNLSDLIEINSISGNEKEICDFLYDKLTQKFSTEIKRVGNNLIIDLDFGKDTTISIGGHIDTVPVIKENWDTNPFKMEEIDNKYYGRGACDMKGGIAIMQTILENLEEIKIENNLQFVFSDKEETGMPNGVGEIINNFRNKLDKVDLFLIPEPTNNEINIGSYGNAFINFNFKGEACHSSSPEKGDNAILKAHDFVEKVKQLQFKKDIILGNDEKESFSINKFNGGHGSNIVPANASVTADYRFLPGRNIKEIEEYFTLLQLEMKEKFGIDYSYEYDCLDPSTHIDKEIINIGEQVANIINKKATIARFWTDQAQLGSKLRKPSFNYGPGSIEQAHTANEYVSKESLENTYNDYLKIIGTPLRK